MNIHKNGQHFLRRILNIFWVTRAAPAEENEVEKWKLQYPAGDFEDFSLFGHLPGYFFELRIIIYRVLEFMASPSMRRLSIMVLKSLTKPCEFGAVRARWLILCGGVLSKRGGSQGRAKGESQGRARGAFLLPKIIVAFFCCIFKQFFYFLKKFSLFSQIFFFIIKYKNTLTNY